MYELIFDCTAIIRTLYLDESFAPFTGTSLQLPRLFDYCSRYHYNFACIQYQVTNQPVYLQLIHYILNNSEKSFQLTVKLISVWTPTKKKSVLQHEEISITKAFLCNIPFVPQHASLLIKVNGVDRRQWTNTIALFCFIYQIESISRKEKYECNLLIKLLNISLK